PAMTRSEKLIAVLEVIVSALLYEEMEDVYMPVVRVTTYDFPHSPMSIYTIGSVLSVLHHAKVLRVTKKLQQPNVNVDELDSWNQIPYVGYEVFVDGNPWRVLRELENG